ncbi:MAG: hypothetical protein ACRC6V_05715 [Bacteroidales bacterium]
MANCVLRSTLRKLTIPQVINMSLNAAIGNDLHEWQRVSRMWNLLSHGCGDRKTAETQLAWAMGYKMITEDVK